MSNLSETERRALIEHHAERLSALNVEPFHGSGLITKERIIETLERQLELAKELSI